MMHFLCFLVSSIPFSTAVLTFPRPKGPYGTAVTNFTLTDPTRLNGWAPTKENAQVVLSLTYPVSPVEECTWSIKPVMPPTTANSVGVSFGVPDGALNELRLEICDTGDSPCGKEDAPVLLFGPA
jgi:hypothetical protein